MIKELSTEQWDRIYALREDTLRRALSTKPADRAATEAGITKLYGYIGKQQPVFVWLDGPASVVLAINLFELEQFDEQLGASLKHQLRYPLRGQLMSQLKDRLGDQLKDRLGDQLGDQIWHRPSDQLWTQIWHQLRGHLLDQLGDQVTGQLWKQGWDQTKKQLEKQLLDQFDHWRLYDRLYAQFCLKLGNHIFNQVTNPLQLENTFKYYRWVYGSEELYWVAWLLAGEIAGVRYDTGNLKRLREAHRLFSNCGWWVPYEGIVFCAERHRRISFDAEQRLHCETGPAIECRDGYSVYAWHGTRIPSEWIDKRDSLDPTTALTWNNIEQRRCAAEIIGWANVLDQLNPRIINKDPDPMIGTLVEVELPGSGRERFLDVRCGTGRRFALAVPPNMQTALQAQAWTYNVDETDIKHSEVRT